MSDEDGIDTSRCPFVVCFIAEFFGTALFIFIGCMAYLAGPLETGPLLPAFSFGLGKLGLLQVYVHLTPAYLNPGLTLGMFILRKIDWRRLLIYWAAEYTGALVGYGILELCAASDHMMCLPIVHKNLSILQGFMIEFIVSMILMMTVAGASDKRLLADSDSTSLRLGLVLAGLYFAAEPYTGACMNPARSVPPCLFNKEWKDHWLYQVAPYTGMALGALVYRYVFDHEHKYSVYNIFDKSEDDDNV
ncbi:hypothetical protein NQ318_009751 [Aromia moschata]|uniref:Aquaporin n=1 Tax=Aromia moschata TaxID=1265417 RepID=A0AAV8YAU2_9CUCU|nr:hypothetical protein NQ318_009751 [Aromia moschata]